MNTQGKTAQNGREAVKYRNTHNGQHTVRERQSTRTSALSGLAFGQIQAANQLASLQIEHVDDSSGLGRHEQRRPVQRKQRAANRRRRHVLQQRGRCAVDLEHDCHASLTQVDRQVFGQQPENT